MIKLKIFSFHICLAFSHNRNKNRECRIYRGGISVFLPKRRSWRNVENRRLWQIYVEFLSGTRKYKIGNSSKNGVQPTARVWPLAREMNLVTADHKVPRGFAHAASTLSSRREQAGGTKRKESGKDREREREGERPWRTGWRRRERASEKSRHSRRKKRGCRQKRKTATKKPVFSSWARSGRRT